jgi:hypothetical protein
MPPCVVPRRATYVVRWVMLGILLIACGVADSTSSDTDSDASAGGGLHDSGLASDDSDSASYAACPPGSYVVDHVGEEITRSCSACPSGKFSAVANAAACAPWRTCAPGSFVREEGSSSRDRVCAPCEPGTESQGPNQAACTPVGTCAAGSERRPGGGPADCDVCSPGSYCPGGSLPKSTCPANTWDSDNDPATPCSPATECLAGQRVFAEPTPLSDRACVACPSGSFSASKNAVICTNFTNCEAGSFVSQAGTQVSDRVCAPCADGTVSTSRNQVTCLPLDACPAGTREAAPASPNAEPECVACTPGHYCAGGKAPEMACAPETWDEDLNPASPCVSWSRCVPGQSVYGEGTSVTDRSCAGCVSGTFSVGDNAASCAAWTACEPGSAVSDRSCAACDPGTYSTAPNQALCLSQNDCPAGTLEVAAASERDPAQCEACETGTFCAGGKALKVPCPSGTWDNDGTSATACTPQTTCAGGQRVLTDGTSTTDRTCVPCAAGIYCAGNTAPEVACAASEWDHDGNSATPCVAKTTCAAGEYVTSSGSATTNRICVPCGSGAFTAITNASICSGWSTCAAGSFVSTAGTASSDRQCTACGAGTFTSSANHTSCVVHSMCTAGTERTALGTATNDTQCTMCSAGNFCPGGSAAKAACASGTWDHDANSATACTAWTSCSPGQYVLTSGTTTTDRPCTTCANGTYSTTSNQASCTSWSTCTAGTYVSASGTTSSDRICSPCPNGTYTSTTNQGACLPQGTCATGTEQTAAGTSTSPTQCAACQSGSYCAGGTASKVSCGSGTWDNDLNASTPCVAWTTCQTGEVMQSQGTATTNRICVSLATACADGIKDGDESDIDCGGSCSSKCGFNQVCSGNSDCKTGVCTEGLCAAKIFNATTDYSTTANPNGVWRSGWTSSTLGSALTVYPTFNGSWNDPAISLWLTPAFGKNAETATPNGIAPSQLWLHPGCSGGQVSVLRWSAPWAGTCAIDARFYAGDAFDMRAAVLRNNTAIYTTNSTSNNPTFSQNVTVSANDTIDIAVRTNTSNQCIYGTTGIALILTCQ